MPRKNLRKLLARVHAPARNKKLRGLFGDLLHNSNLWHLNRYSVAWGVSVGLFMAFVPVPLQMILAAAAAIVIGCNLPVAIAVVWISNPITWAPMYFFAYKVGAWILNVKATSMEFEMSIDWLVNSLGAIWEPFLLGCLVLGLTIAAIGHLAVRVIWRIHVVNSWRERQRRREARLARLSAQRDRKVSEISETRPDA